MAKKQTRRSISVSRGTYERLKAYCETNQISMSQFVERRVGDYLGRSGAAPQPAPSAPSAPRAARPAATPANEPVRTDAFSIATGTPAQPVAAPITAPAPASRLSSINQPISQAVAAPKVAPKPLSDEPMLKDPDEKLSADQIFTF
ncbi:MAG: hypothetical protein GY811_05610 [Myxococcales bacterium]|nr:hypothetical protein [Myxococcales bacterium]